MNIQIEGLDNLIEKFRRWPDKFRRSARATMEASLLVIHESVPPYPPPPAGSTYDRTGTLGRRLGAGGGSPDIYEVREAGNYFEGSFGTNLEYAPWVIDEDRQAWMHRGRWWTLQGVGRRAKDRIVELWAVFADELGDWLKSQGM